MPIPDSLTHKMALFKQAGRIFRDDNELFTRASWVAVMLGQNLYPKTNEPILANIPMEQIQRSLASMKNAMTQAATQLPEHAAFIKKYTASQYSANQYSANQNTAHKSGPRF
jgi:tryptophan halogenase